jgi:hypothetical protein
VPVAQALLRTRQGKAGGRAVVTWAVNVMRALWPTFSAPNSHVIPPPQTGAASGLQTPVPATLATRRCSGGNLSTSTTSLTGPVPMPVTTSV